MFRDGFDSLGQRFLRGPEPVLESAGTSSGIFGNNNGYSEKNQNHNSRVVCETGANYGNANYRNRADNSGMNNGFEFSAAASSATGKARGKDSSDNSGRFTGRFTGEKTADSYGTDAYGRRRNASTSDGGTYGNASSGRVRNGQSASDTARNQRTGNPVRIPDMSHPRARREIPVTSIGNLDDINTRSRSKSALSAITGKSAVRVIPVSSARPVPVAAILMALIATLLLMFIVYNVVSMNELTIKISDSQSRLASLIDDEKELKLKLELKNDLLKIERIAVDDYDMVKSDKVVKEYINIEGKDKIVFEKIDDTQSNPSESSKSGADTFSASEAGADGYDESASDNGASDESGTDSALSTVMSAFAKRFDSFMEAIY